MKTDNLILDLTFEFSLNVIEYVELLEENRKYVIGRQLLNPNSALELKK